MQANHEKTGEDAPRSPWVYLPGLPMMLARFPVTNAEYAAWLRSLPPEEAARRYSPLMEQHFFGGINRDYSVKPGFEKKPVVFVSWFDAQAYAAAHGCVLPPPLVWKIFAAWKPGGQSAKYAHGKDTPPTQAEANVYDPGAGWALPAPHLADVDAYPPGPLGLYGMAGNVAEWVDAGGEGWQPALGGSCFRTADFAALDAGEADDPSKRLSTISFRLALVMEGRNGVISQDLQNPSQNRQNPVDFGSDSVNPVKSGTQVAPEWVAVGETGNRPYRWRVGCVPYVFEAARCQVTNADWCRFLNAVGREKAVSLRLFHPDMAKGILGGIDRLPDGSFAPKPGWERRPVVYVNWFALLRYCNFLTNGGAEASAPAAGMPPPPSTETGSYDMSQPLPQRMEGGVYFLPTDDEWVKAAYYDPAARCYRHYPSGDARPTQDAANYQPDDTLAEGPPFYLAEVDAYGAGASAYGLLQAGGNAWEFLENVVNGKNLLRGGSFGYTETGLDIANRDAAPLGDGCYVFGARIVRVPGGWRNECLRYPAKYAILRAVGKWKIARTALGMLRGCSRKLSSIAR